MVVVKPEKGTIFFFVLRVGLKTAAAIYILLLFILVYYAVELWSVLDYRAHVMSYMLRHVSASLFSLTFT